MNGNTPLDLFRTARDGILSVIQEVQTIEDELGSGSGLLEVCRTNLIEESLQVVVVGEFNRGKSYLINALLGTMVLPTGARPTTAALTFIKHGREPSAEVRYLPEYEIAPRAISLDALAGLITALTPESEKEAIKIETVTVFYPSKLCKNGVLIVDTPGINDCNELREKITYGFIPQSDAAIFVLDATMPLSLTEKEFLQEHIVSNNIQKIFFVLNKAGLVSKEELPEVIEYARDGLHKIPGLSDEIRLYAVDSKSALNGDADARARSGIDRFSADLGAFLVDERGRLIIHSAASKVRLRVSELKSRIDATVKLMGIHVSEMEQEERKLMDVAERAEKRRRLLLAELDSIMEDTIDKTRRKLPLVYDLALADMRAQILGSRGIPTLDQLQGYRNNMASAIVRHFDSLLTGDIEQCLGKMADAVERDVETTALQVCGLISEISSSAVSESKIVSPAIENSAKADAGLLGAFTWLATLAASPASFWGLVGATVAGFVVGAAAKEPIMSVKARQSLVSSLEKSKPRVVDGLLAEIENQLLRERERLGREALPALDSALAEATRAFEEAKALRESTEAIQAAHLARLADLDRRLDQCLAEIETTLATLDNMGVHSYGREG